MPETLSTIDVSPYIGLYYLEYTSENPPPFYFLISKLRKRVEHVFKEIKWKGTDLDRVNSSIFVTTFFEEKHLPNWLKKEHAEVTSNNTEHHYFTMGIVEGGRYALHFSDESLKECLLQEIKSHFLVFVQRARLNSLVLTDDSEVRAIWMRGIHRRTISKADTKFLTGENLKAAIDPLSDQSYAYNAARVHLDIGGNRISMGVNLAESFFWIKKVETWKDFLSVAHRLGEEINGIKKLTESPLHTLSHPVMDLKELSNPYEISIADEETLPPNMITTQLSRIIQEFTNNYRVDLTPHSTGNPSGWRWMVTHMDNGKNPFFIGSVDAAPTLDPSGMVSFNYVLTPERGRKKQLDRFAVFLNRANIWTVRYESGHVITESQCFKQTYKDVSFNDFVWADFEGVNIEKEKPLDSNKVLNLGMSGSSDSLFCWLVNSILRSKRNKKYRHLELASIDDWLVCDDGAGEIADFIHFGTLEGRTSVTFIHIKSANSPSLNRKISCSAYEVVLGQAIKNIRSIDLDILKSDLLQKIGGGKKMVWGLNLPHANPGGFALFLSTLTGPINTNVMVVQPHTMRKHYRSDKYSKQRVQLNTLLVNAKQVITGLGASFTVVGDMGR